MNDEIVLESTQIKVAIDYQRGGTITKILENNNSANWIYYDASRRNNEKQNERIYDDIWCGGFEELFPNDAACIFEGRKLLDHGELWDAPFEILEHTSSSVHLRRRCVTVPAIFEKKISIMSNSSQLTIDYSIFNTSQTEFSYLFKLHSAMLIEEGDKIFLPGGKVFPVDLQFSGIIGSEGPFEWPNVVGKDVALTDLSSVPNSESRLQEFVYVTQLPESWCGFFRTRNNKRIKYSYSQNIFPYCWLFISYGGWRNYYTVVLEPCTNMPKDLLSAKKLGQCAILNSGERISFSVEIEISEQ